MGRIYTHDASMVPRGERQLPVRRGASECVVAPLLQTAHTEATAPMLSPIIRGMDRQLRGKRGEQGVVDVHAR